LKKGKERKKRRNGTNRQTSFRRWRRSRP
jgi:hypothetical protein